MNFYWNQDNSNEILDVYQINYLYTSLIIIIFLAMNSPLHEFSSMGMLPNALPSTYSTLTS
jgi:hypothetical protein